jgi:hypothetical protein
VDVEWGARMLVVKCVCVESLRKLWSILKAGNGIQMGGPYISTKSSVKRAWSSEKGRFAASGAKPWFGQMHARSPVTGTNRG